MLIAAGISLADIKLFIQQKLTILFSNQAFNVAPVQTFATL
jgi:hypothetical protein